MSKWSTAPLSEVATVFDGPHATPTKTTDGPWYLSISSLCNGRVDLSQSAHLSDLDLPKWTRRVSPIRGDTLFSYETRIGEAAHWDSDATAALGRRMGLLRPKLDRIDPRFLTYAYLGPQFQEVIRAETVHGATVDRILIAEMPRWPLAIPSLPEQRRIAQVLGAFDDFIDANRELLVDLEATARHIAATAKSCAPLGELAAPTTTRQTRPSGVVEHYSLPAFDAGAAPEIVDAASIKSNKLVLSGPTVLVSRLNPRWERCWMAYPDSNAVCSTEFVPLGATADGNTVAEEIWAVTSGHEFWEQMRSMVTGTTGSHQRVDKNAVLALSVPDVRSLGPKTRRCVADLVRSAHECRLEVADLVRVRDELLPLLMSGRVRVREVG